MKSVMHQALGMLTVGLLLAPSAWNQTDPNPDRLLSPDRGVSVGRAYQVSEIESVNMSNGGLSLRIPLAQLPTGPAGTAGVSLVYSSKYWEDLPASFASGGSKSVTHVLQGAPAGGWRLRYDYELRAVYPETRTAYADVCAPGAAGLVQLRLMEPDGSEHQLYSLDVPAASIPQYCEAGTYRREAVDNSTAKRWYSLDGSFLRLVMEPGSIWPDNDWTLYERDGGRVEFRNLAGGEQRTTRFDRSGNQLVWSRGTYVDDSFISHAKDTLADEFGHKIEVVHFGDHDEVWQTGVGGGKMTWRVNYGLLDVTGLLYYNNSHGGQQTSAPFSAPPDSVTSVELPARGTPSGGSYTPKFEFQHSSRFRELSQMKLPSGAIVNYVWALDGSSTQLGYQMIQVRALAQKSVQHSVGGVPRTDVTTYSFPTDASATITSSSVTGPDDGVTSHEFWQGVSYYATNGPLAGMLKKMTKPDGSTSGKTWATNLPAGGKGIESSRANQHVLWEYETAANASGSPALVKTRGYTVDQNGNTLMVNERDWTAGTGEPASAEVGTLVRVTETTPQFPAPPVGATTSNGSLYVESIAPAVLSNIAARTMKNGTGVTALDTTYGYNGNGILTTENVRDLRPGVDTRRTTTYIPDPRGRVTSVRDADSVGADFAYTSCGGFGLSSMTPTGIGPTSFALNCAVGEPAVLLSRTNPQGRTDVFSYDQLGRLTQMDAGTLKRTRYIYDDQNLWTMERSDVVAFNDGLAVSVVYEDALGRERLRKTLENAAGLTDVQAADEAREPAIRVETGYETTATQSVVKVSNPYRTNESGDVTRGWTVHLRDRSGRLCAVEQYAGAGVPGGGTCSAAGAGHGGRTSLVYGTTALGTSVTETVNGTPNQVTERVSDGLGRLAQVTENGTQITSYGFDAAGRLVSVNQPGQAGQAAQTRTFVYSTMGQLVSADNPESGTIVYDYTPGGRMLTKKMPRSAGVFATVCVGTWNGSSCAAGLDAAGRPNQTSYSDGTPTVTYAYSGPWLMSVVNAAATIEYQYDLLDRVKSRTQTVDDTAYGFTARYGASVLTSESYHGGRVLTYAFDGAGRVTGLSGQKGAQSRTYLNSAAYAAHGAVRSLGLGNALTETWGWNHRLQPASVVQGSYSLGFYYCPAEGGSCGTNNGNMVRQRINHASVAQNYTFDGYNRLASVAEGPVAGGTNWSRNFEYDAFGNGWVSGWTVLAPDGQTPVTRDNFDPLTNQLKLQLPQYDLSGNQTVMAGSARTFDAENRMTGNVTGGVTTSYSYDGEGKRVKTVQGAVTTRYLYSASGRLAQEYTTGGTPPAAQQCDPCYVGVDHLGSTRAVIGQTGTVVGYLDYLPFGEELAAGVSGRSALYGAAAGRVKFTGKERDAETGLDYFGARYMSAAQGRFTSPDAPFNDQHPEDPQSWNLYSYTRNNPLAHVDVNGEFVATVTGALAGGLIGGAVEAYRGGSFWKGAASGAVSGAIAGSIIDTGGASLGVLALAGAAGGVGGGVVGRALEGQGTSVGDVARDASVGAVAGAVGGKLGEVVVNKVAGMVVQRAANAAVDAVGPGSGAAYGTRVHSAMEGALNKSGVAKALNLNTEVSYSGGQVVSRGTPGSVRVDVVRGNPSNPGAAFDLKTGTAKLTPGRTQQIQQAMPRPVPVKEIRPEVP